MGRKLNICLVCWGISIVILTIVLVCAGLATSAVFGKGIRDSALYRVETDNASQVGGGELCAEERVNAFMFHLSNWEQVRIGQSSTPVFEEVGPYNFTRTVCTFDRHLVPGSNPPAVRFRKYHGPWQVASKPGNGGVGVDVNRKLYLVNPAYHGVMATLQRASATPISGIEAETSLHSQITAGALKAVMQGILDRSPDGFLASTFVGAIPSILGKVVDGLDQKIPSFVPGTDERSPIIATQYLWARPVDCLDYSRGFVSCQYLKILNSLMSDGMPLDANSPAKFQGFEVGTRLNVAFESSTLSFKQVQQLWDPMREDSLRHVDGIVLWNTSRADRAQSLQLQGAFNMTADQLHMVQRWVEMFSTRVTPALVTNALLGDPGPALVGYNDKQYLLAWKQLGEGTVSAQRGKRESDGLPKTIHDVNPRVPFEFEISHWARLNKVALPITTPWHLEFIFNGTSPEAPYAGLTNPLPLFAADGITALLGAVRDLDDAARAQGAADTCQKNWRMDALQCKSIGRYIQWFFESLLEATGPVIHTTAMDVLVDRVDPLLTILKTAGRVPSDRSGVLYAPGDAPTRDIAAAMPFELETRVWDGTGEGSGLALSDTVPEGYTKAFQRAEWATSANGSDFYIYGELTRTWAKPVPITGGNGERFHFGVEKSDALHIWNDRLARTLTWSYAGDATLEDIDVWQFKLNEDEFAPDPTYFQTHKGLFNLSGTSPADVFVSLPRFAGVDASVHGVELRPSAQELKCCTGWRIFVEPTSGVTMGKEVVTQINFKSPGFGAFAGFKLPAGYMPLTWLEDRVVIDPKQAAQFKSGLSLASTARIAAFVLAPLLFILCGACMVYAFFRAKRSNPSADLGGFEMH
jgi:hypothetical protein